MVEIRTQSAPVGSDGRRPTPDERRRYGRNRRSTVARREHATVIDPVLRPGPMLQLAAATTAQGREHAAIQRDLLLASPAAWYEGTPAFAIADLAPTPRTGIRVQTYGDAAIGRFAPMRAEGTWWIDAVAVPHTLPGPWEWDLKRLVTSVVLAARLAGHRRTEQAEAAVATVAAYRGAIHDLATKAPLDVWATRVPGDQLVADAMQNPPPQPEQGHRATIGSRPEVVGRRRGGHRIASRPPGVMPLEGEPENQPLAALFHRYLAALPDDRWTLARRFDYLDGARVLGPPGVGGSHHWLALLGDDTGRHLVLRFDVATPSALAPHLSSRRRPERDGHRIVTGWRLLSPARDPFLGAIVDTASDRDLVVSQHRPLGPALTTDTIRPGQLQDVARAAAQVIAAGHARSGDATELAGYLGDGDALDQAIAQFARLSADLAERDHAGAMAAVRGLAASASTASAPTAADPVIDPGTARPTDGTTEPTSEAPDTTEDANPIPAAPPPHETDTNDTTNDPTSDTHDTTPEPMRRHTDDTTDSTTDPTPDTTDTTPAPKPPPTSDATTDPTPDTLGVPPATPEDAPPAEPGRSWDTLPDDEHSPREYVAPDLSTVEPPTWATGPIEEFARDEDVDGRNLIPRRRWFRRKKLPRSQRR